MRQSHATRYFRITRKKSKNNRFFWAKTKLAVINVKSVPPVNLDFRSKNGTLRASIKG